MRIIKFPYVLYKGLSVPIIPLQIQSGSEWFDLWAFVDSRATYSIFSAKDAHDMGIDLRKGHKEFVVVGDGSYIPVTFFKMPIRIEDFELHAVIGFSEKLGVGFNLLGRRDIFDTFTVCFNDANKMISLQTNQ